MIYRTKRTRRLKKRIRKVMDGDDMLDRVSKTLSLGGAVERSQKDIIGKALRKNSNNNRKRDVAQGIIDRINKKLNRRY